MQFLTDSEEQLQRSLGTLSILINLEARPPGPETNDLDKLLNLNKKLTRTDLQGTMMR